MKLIDFRSDTVTRPDKKMLKAMLQARVGDDVYGDDPTVNELQQKAAEITGKEDSLFVPSGTQSNLIALMTHCQRGEEYIVGQQAHTYQFEAGGAAVLGSIQPQPIDFEADGSLSLVKIKNVIKPDDPHFARTKLICLENTHNGKVVPQEKIIEIAKLANTKNLNMHLDGARIANAAVSSGKNIDELCEPFESVSMCLSKGLGAPVGSVLCAPKDFIIEAKRWRKMLGGGMRQAGYLAAAGIYALKNNIKRLEQDHENAKLLCAELLKIDEKIVPAKKSFTNMIFVKFPQKTVKILEERLSKNNILFSIKKTGESRLVLHKDVSEKDVKKFVEEVKNTLKI